MPTFDEPFTGGTPAGANAEVTDPERLRVGVAQERSRLAFLAHRQNAVVPPARFCKTDKRIVKLEFDIRYERTYSEQVKAR